MKFLAPALALLACVVPVQSRQTSDQSEISAEEYAIYTAAINSLLSGQEDSSASKARALVIEDHTTNNSFTFGEDERSFLEKQFLTISKETIDDYVAKNAKSYQLTESFDFGLKYILVSKEKTDLILKGRWREFYKQFPNSRGFITVSRVGLDSSGKQAVVYTGSQWSLCSPNSSHLVTRCGGFCGIGFYVLLAKNDQGWAVQQKLLAWLL
jgi:hypothetical protein